MSLWRIWGTLILFLIGAGPIAYWSWNSPGLRYPQLYWMMPTWMAVMTVIMVARTVRNLHDRKLGRPPPNAFFGGRRDEGPMQVVGDFFLYFMCFIAVIFLVAFVWAMWLMASGQVGG